MVPSSMGHFEVNLLMLHVTEFSHYFDPSSRENIQEALLDK